MGYFVSSVEDIKKYIESYGGLEEAIKEEDHLDSMGLANNELKKAIIEYKLSFCALDMVAVYQLINKKRQLEDMDVNPLTMFAEAWEYKQKEIERLNAVPEQSEDWKEISMRALSGCKLLKNSANWVHVKNVVGVGSTRATKICIDLGIDPEGTVFKKKNGESESV